ncbi:CocE/NonD family hydrolase [Nocardioides sp. TRM66260-LWL]|uniref:CocE/NonD family hydrolase n=1 Tax=Nocardioides sp. TRM66260-LWL TaxID=2874478 RepID=UPI001CC3C089|nr:CocE/NonD family hydrolase [Nocardioides sp. TRM66260-LWL]MBZ5735737.1 CocE/NonD family hydrolase [Nocardioides sp. TRM66260-LWL]
MSRSRSPRPSLAGLAVLAAITAGLAATPAATAAPVAVVASTATASRAPVASVASVARRDGWTPRAEQYPGTVTRRDLAIPMSDGTILRGDLTLPAGADGTAIPSRVPVVVTITAYNKTVLASSPLGGGDGSYLVKRGYAQLTVDARGTGSSEGSWGAFSARENRDATEIMAWAHRQPWSDGRTAMTGPSYMGISQVFAAAGRPPGLKAIFPQVPGGDVYRDVVASGGQIDAAFIPLWLGLVTGAGITPPAVTATDPASGFKAFFDHLVGLATFTGPLIPKALLDGEPAYDGPFYAERSPLNVVDRVQVPTFLVSGEYDLFQRGTPLLFERLQQQGVPVKMVIGPWDHLQGSSGAGLEQAGHGSLQELQLRWFDHYVKGLPDPSLDADIPPLTYYEQGSGVWRTGQRWVDGRQRATRLLLSGASTPVVRAGGLTGNAASAQPGASALPPVPLAGLCSRSTNQWTAGVPNAFPVPNPCLTDNRLNDLAGLTFETAPLRRGLSVQGPIGARLYVSSTTGDGLLSVAVEDVAPDGTVSRLTGGWQVISLRQLDRARSRYLDGRLIQPFHPFTRESRQPLAAGRIAPVDVEVFPTAARIAPGHRLRLAVQAFDTPHLLSPLPGLLGQLGVITVHSGGRTPSSLTLPTLR